MMECQHEHHSCSSINKYIDEAPLTFESDMDMIIMRQMRLRREVTFHRFMQVARFMMKKHRCMYNSALQYLLFNKVDSLFFSSIHWLHFNFQVTQI